MRRTSAIAWGLRGALWFDGTISEELAPARFELQYGTTPSLLLGASPRPRSPSMVWNGIPAVVGSLVISFTKRLLGESVSMLVGMRLVSRPMDHGRWPH